jgi:hypothetical protein
MIFLNHTNHRNHIKINVQTAFSGGGVNVKIFAKVPHTGFKTPNRGILKAGYNTAKTVV